MSNAWVQRDRARRLVAANLHTKTCQRRAGRQVCGGTLRDLVDGLGRVVRSCERCARRKAGLCRDCPRPVEGRIGDALRCTRCKTAHNKRYNTAHARHRGEKHRASARESWRRKSGFYERRGLVPPPIRSVGRPALSPTQVARTAARAREHKRKAA